MLGHLRRPPTTSLDAFAAVTTALRPPGPVPTWRGARVSEPIDAQGEEDHPGEPEELERAGLPARPPRARLPGRRRPGGRSAGPPPRTRRSTARSKWRPRPPAEPSRRPTGNRRRWRRLRTAIGCSAGSPASRWRVWPAARPGLPELPVLGVGPAGDHDGDPKEATIRNQFSRWGHDGHRADDGPQQESRRPRSAARGRHWRRWGRKRLIGCRRSAARSPGRR